MKIDVTKFKFKDRLSKMSWSTGEQKGTPQEVKQALIEKFDYSKRGTANIPVENKSVVAAEAIVNDLLDAMIDSEHPKVTVNAGGSASSAQGKLMNISFNLIVNPY